MTDRPAKPGATRTGSERDAIDDTAVRPPVPPQVPAGGAAPSPPQQSPWSSAGQQTAQAAQQAQGEQAAQQAAEKAARQEEARAAKAAEAAERARQREAQKAEKQAAKAARSAGRAQTRVQPQARPAPRSPRKARLRMSRVDPWSVMKTSFLLAIAFGIVTVVSVLMVWSVLGAADVWGSINSTVSDIGGQEAADFDIENYLGTSRVLGFTVLLAAVNVVLLTAIATLAAFLYNMSAALLGGVEVTLSEDN